MKRAFVLLCGLVLAAAPRLVAQERGAAALGELVHGLGTTTRVLMIGAHPDDEDTQLIAYLAKGKHIETAYLALTRGDGGQNLIGNELGEELGMIRTEELLAARRIDGGRQYFTRAYDFGFVKTLDETLQKWPKDSILKDAVAIVRAYRPQVIIAVFTGTPRDGHGQHQYSGVIAREVFDAAADSVRYPASQLGGLRPWSVGTFYRLVRGGNGPLRFDVGTYDPILGESYSEIATLSRSQHRSQGQGALPQYGPRYSAVNPEVSRVADFKAGAPHGLFDGMDTSWTRFKSLPLPDSSRTALDSLAGVEGSLVSTLDLTRPSTAVAPLAHYLRLVNRAAAAVHCTTLQVLGATPACSPAMADLALALRTTRQRATDALLDAAAIRVDATAPRELVAERDTLPVTVSVYDQGTAPVQVERVALDGQNAAGAAAELNRDVQPDNALRTTVTYRAGDQPTMAWWLRRPRWHDMFSLIPAKPGPYVSQEMITGEDRLQDSGADVALRIDGVNVPVETGPIVHRFADPARGEVRLPIGTAPAVTLLLQNQVEYARSTSLFDRTYAVSIHSAAATPRDVAVSLTLPAGVRADSAIKHVRLDPFGDASVYFRVQGRLAAGTHEVAARASVGDTSYTTGFVPINYEHIRPLRYYRPAEVRVEAVNATFAGLRVGYIRGVGDNELPMLEELGIPVTELDPATLPQAKLASYSTIVVGPRAYEANKSLIANNSILMRFARDGGTIVTQYGQAAYEQPGILPYPITLARPADRVTDENAPVRVIDPGSPLVSTPNKITEADFANWVQERTSYMPRTFDAHYRTVFSLNDPGEPPNDAAVLVAPLGRGTYVYTTFVFFRELPAGNPGAARLFINLLSAKQNAADRPAVSSKPIRP